MVPWPAWADWFTKEGTPGDPVFPAPDTFVPASAIPTDSSEWLFVNSWNSASGVKLSVNVSAMNPKGTRNLVTLVSTPNTNRSRKTDAVQLQAGYVLDMFVQVLSGTIATGQCFVQVGITRGQPATGQAYSVERILYQNYLDVNGSMTYPQIKSQEGPGWINTISLPAPAAGASYAPITVPTGARWKVRGFAGALTDGAGAGNRRPVIDYKDGSGNLLTGGVSPTFLGASLSATFFGSIGGPAAETSNSVANNVGINLPDTFLPSGYTVNFTTEGIAAADQWAAGFLTVEEWIDL